MTAQKSIAQSDRKKAFTLVELLVSMSILALLLVLLLSIVNGATKLWRDNENRVDAYREARAALNVIASDLSSIYISPNSTDLATPNLKLFYTQKDNTPVTPVSITGMDGRLFFLTATPTGAQEQLANKSDLCTVGYFLGFDKTSLTGKGVESYNLYRYFRSSNDTYTAMSSGAIAGPPPQHGDILSGVTVGTEPTSITCEVLAKNITGFTVVPYTIPAPASPGGVYGKPREFNKTADTPLPDMIEITIKAISNQTTKRFTKSDGSADKPAWEKTDSLARQQNERTFQTRVYLSGAAQLTTDALKAQYPTPSPTPKS